ncbi:MAG: hypothetical protein V7L05_16070 [Nostoc sp.]
MENINDNYQFQMPNAQCPMPNAQCPIPNTSQIFSYLLIYLPLV